MTPLEDVSEYANKQMLIEGVEPQMKILSRNPHENEEIGQYRERFGKEIFQFTIVLKMKDLSLFMNKERKTVEEEE